ncbi:MAG: TRAP transporter substrate-binding protein [Termitinemataceae bacterium]|nr:MAG: TRAP transporter substrate-binding protein [Termitinemataceae bacterium]
MCKKVLRLIMAFCVLAAIAGCKKDDKIVIKVGDTWAETHPIAAAMDNVFKPMVEEKTGGRYKVEIYHDGILGGEADQWNAVRNGTTEVVVLGSVMNTEWMPMLISDWPFLYRDIDHAAKVWTGPIADEMSERFNAVFPSTEMLAWAPNSARTFTSNKKLTSVDDFKGQKFRMPSNPIHTGIAANLGSSAQVIPLGDLYTSLQTGVVDGQDNGMVTVIAQGLQEVQKYLYETNHIIATMEIIISKPFMDKLPAEDQQIIRDAAKASAAQAWVEYANSIDRDRQKLVDAGMIVTPCTPEDKAKIIEKIKPLTDKLLADNADWAPELISKVTAVN